MSHYIPYSSWMQVIYFTFMQINFLTVVGLSVILGRWLGMVVYIINYTTTGCALVACGLQLAACCFKKNGARPPRSVDCFGLMALFPREFCLVFSITNIFNVLIPASSTVSTLAALSWRWAAGASISHHG